MKLVYGALAFIFTAAFCALCFWIGGYDFDRRNPDIAFGFFLSTATAFCAALVVICYPTKKTP